MGIILGKKRAATAAPVSPEIFLKEAQNLEFGMNDLENPMTKIDSILDNISDIKLNQEIRNHIVDFKKTIEGIGQDVNHSCKDTLGTIKSDNDKFMFIVGSFMDRVSNVIKNSMKFILGLGLATGIVLMIFAGLTLILVGVLFTVIVALGLKALEKNDKRRDVAKFVVIDMVLHLEELEKEAKAPEEKQRYKAMRTELLNMNKLKESDIAKVRNMTEDYNWDEMEFGLDNLSSDYDDEIIDDIETYDHEQKDEESEFYNYAIEKEEYTDEEVDKLVTKYLKIRDANTYQKIRAMFTDFRGAVKESAKKHGNFVFDTDEKDDEKDDVRMMTKAEAIMIVDNVLASKYRTYLLAFEHFRRDSSRTLTFAFLTTIFFSCLAISGLVVILPIAAVFTTAASVGNFYALFRDLKRTRLVIIKEIERIDNTVERMMKEENPDKEKIKLLLEIKKSLITQAGYDPKSDKWNKLKDPEVVKKITQMITYFGESVLTLDDIRINILEADAEDAATTDDEKKAEKKNEDELTGDDTEEEPTDKEEDTGEEDDAPETDGDLADTQDDYLNSDPTKEATEGSDQFDAGGTDKEEAYKLKYCLDNLDVLHEKYSTLHDDIISSDIYKIVNEDIKNKSRDLLNELLGELSIALDNLQNYIQVGDKSSYPLVAFKLSVHQNLMRNIDAAIQSVVTKESNIE